MSWFSALLPSAVAPAPAPYPTNSLPVETLAHARSGPRAKAKSQLHKWEAPSDEEDGGNDVDDQSDVRAGVSNRSSPSNRISRQGSNPSRMGSMDSVGDASNLFTEDQRKDQDYTIRTMPPLRSYEEAVLDLKMPRSLQRARIKTQLSGDEATAIPDDSDSTDEDESKGPAHAAAMQEKMRHQLKVNEKLLAEELSRTDRVRRQESIGVVSQVQASRAIVSVSKVKLSLMRQKMTQYEESEKMGTEDSVRARKLLVWAAGLSFLKAFDVKMKQPEIEEAKMRNYLKNLDLNNPPPPPPPAEEPPNDEDEELHDKYEAMVRKYKKQWTAEGNKVLGPAKFEEIRNRTKDGPASKEKKIIAAKCLEEAGQVLNEDEYQELLRKAWRLQDDHAALSEYDPKAFAREVAKSSNWGNNKKT